jgi:putative tryptophan/tyrosine transport system substrate-binding protein
MGFPNRLIGAVRPVEEPTRFQLLLKLKTGKALGLELPASPLDNADDLLE